MAYGCFNYGLWMFLVDLPVFFNHFPRRCVDVQVLRQAPARNHNSVPGIRDVARDASVPAAVISQELVDDWLDRLGVGLYIGDMMGYRIYIYNDYNIMIII